MSRERALWQAREQLIQTKRGIVFTRFDIVWGKLWERSYQMPIKRNRELLPEEVGWIANYSRAVSLYPLLATRLKQSICLDD